MGRSRQDHSDESPQEQADGARQTWQGRRVEPRVKCRLRCTLESGEMQAQGLILDISQEGLYVQTKLAPPRGTLTVRIPDPEGVDEIVLTARVRRQRKIDVRLSTFDSSGLGLMIVSAPDSYTSLIAGSDGSPGRSEASQGGEGEPEVASGGGRSGRAGEPPEEPELPAFRVRVSQRGTPRTRALIRHAETAKDAEQKVLRELGGDWEIEEIEEL